jgi:hypothetical protein
MRIELITTAAALAMGLVLPAAGATTNYSGQTANYNGRTAIGPEQQSAHQTQQAQQIIYHSLSQAGFSDIRVMPNSFVVHAKDPQGNRVVMLVTPNSVAAVTSAAPNMANNPGQGSGLTGNNAMANSAHAGNMRTSAGGNGQVQR